MKNSVIFLSAARVALIVQRLGTNKVYALIILKCPNKRQTCKSGWASSKFEQVYRQNGWDGESNSKWLVAFQVILLLKKLNKLIYSREYRRAPFQV